MPVYLIHWKKIQCLGSACPSYIYYIWTSPFFLWTIPLLISFLNNISSLSINNIFVPLFQWTILFSKKNNSLSTSLNKLKIFSVSPWTILLSFSMKKKFRSCLFLNNTFVHVFPWTILFLTLFRNNTLVNPFPETALLFVSYHEQFVFPIVQSCTVGPLHIHINNWAIFFLK